MSSIFMGKPDEPAEPHPLREFTIDYHNGTNQTIQATHIHFNNSMIAFWANTSGNNNHLVIALNSELIDAIAELS